MRIRYIAIVLLTVLFGVPSGEGSAATMYAKNDGVKVTAEKSPLSKVVATLNRGDSIRALGVSGRHVKVKVSSGKVGWVFKFKLSDKPIKRGRGRSALSVLSGEERIAAREARSGGSIRGLKEVSDTYAEDRQIAPVHKEAVDRMEQLTVSREELLRFQQEGRIGEFAGGGS